MEVVEDALVTVRITDPEESHKVARVTEFRMWILGSTTATTCKSLGKGELEGQGIQGVNSAWSAVHKKLALVLAYFASEILHPCFISYDAYLSRAKSFMGGQSYECLWKDQNSLFCGDLAALLTQLLGNSVFINFYPDKCGLSCRCQKFSKNVILVVLLFGIALV